jgi:hypothetical protein
MRRWLFADCHGPRGRRHIHTLGPTGGRCLTRHLAAVQSREHADMAGIADMGRRFVSTTGAGLRGLTKNPYCPLMARPRFLRHSLPPVYIATRAAFLQLATAWAARRHIIPLGPGGPLPGIGKGWPRMNRSCFLHQ